jgi:hypothetical protein
LIGIFYFVFIYKRFTSITQNNISLWKKYYKYLPCIITIAIAGFFESILFNFRDESLIFWIIILSTMKFKSAKRNIISDQNFNYRSYQ